MIRRPRADRLAVAHPIAPRRLLRNAVFALIAAGTALGATAATAADTIEQTAVEFAAVRDPQLGAQVAIANHYGYFKDAGLDVTVHWTQSGADIITFMATGQQNLAAGSTFGQVVTGPHAIPPKTTTPPPTTA